MRYFSYVISDDDINITKMVYSEEEIVAEFWEFWTTEMKGNGFKDLISRENCIQDWVAYNWAVQEDVFKFRDKYQGKVFIISEFHPADPEFNKVTLSCLNDNSLVLDGWYDIRTMERADV